MLELFNLEKQVNKRVHRFLLHKATEENIDVSKTKLVFNIIIEKVSVHLYEDRKHIKTLTIKSIAEFFGKEYDEAKVVSLSDYLKKIAKENNVELTRANIVICETKSVLGAHLYNENKYVKRIPTVDLLTAVY